MATRVHEDEHLRGLAVAVRDFAADVRTADPSAPVPTCPGWTVRDLVAHQGMVHRWATGALRGQDLPAEPLEAEGLASDDPDRWLESGAEELLTTLRTVPTDVDAPVFLKDPPAPRAFWARRQCHETVIHGVDARAALLGRAPSVQEVSIDPVLALDGIDELLTGFLPRRKAKVHLPEVATLAVATPDAWWQIVIGPDPVVTTRHDGDAPAGDWIVRGDPVELYLRLWHRLDVTEHPDDWPPGWQNFTVTW
jgi:uncharacterized protein (TIGR03083 family)